MFNKRIHKLLDHENPIDKKDVETNDNDQIEVTITSVGGEIEEVPDFFKMFEEKNLTNDEKDDTMDDPSVEIEALKRLIKNLKSEM